MAHESHLLRVCLSTAHFLEEEVAAANESIRLPPASIHAVNRRSTILAIDSHSLVHALLVRAEPAEEHAHVLVDTLDNHYCVSINLAHGADRRASISKLRLPGPASRRRPIKLATKVVLGDHVFVSFEPKRIHFYN